MTNQYSTINIHELNYDHNITLYVLRLDLIDGITGGNKYFKLKYNLEEARKVGHDTLLTFGGAYSNHIAATALAGKQNNFKTIGIIRGEKPEVLSHTLKQAMGNGMRLVFWSREKYKGKNEYENIMELQDEFGQFYMIPEGGSNKFAVKGCAEILNELDADFDVVCVPVGTGATLAGIVHSLNENQKALGFSALKDGAFLKEDVLKLLHSYEGKNFDRKESESKFNMITDYHFGGYAKYTDELIAFIKKFNEQYSIPLDFVYTGKMMYGVMKLIGEEYFGKDKRIVVVHTGGLQGNVGIGI